MTYTATRYVRTPGKSHACPDAYTGRDGIPSHGLIPAPDEPGLYVCPYAYDQERAEVHRAQIAADEAAERHALAEKIAADQIELHGLSVEADEVVTTYAGKTWRSILIAALTEKESA